MPIDIATVAQQILAAINTAVSAAAPAQTGALKNIATNFASSLAAIEEDRANGSINDAQAQGYLQASVDFAKAALITQLGLAAPTVKSALTAALNVLITVAGNALGLGWAVPIIQTVLGGL